MIFNSCKRILDICGATLLLVVTSPLFVLIAAAVKLDSPGPVFYRQKRLGRKGQLFSILKFRSMKVGTPEVATDRLLHPDHHITRTGKFLRKTSLDEIPQLFNILQGSMSFIGPRPSLHNQRELNESRIKLGITAVRPGLSGYAQINGRDSIDDNQKLEYDLYYITNMSLRLDFYIFCKTLLQFMNLKNLK